MTESGRPYPAAVLSADRRYRYLLARRVGFEEAVCTFIMLNPSTADAETDDPTIRRCIDFAQRWDCGRLLVVNLFAYRTTSPAALYAAADPVGPENDAYLRQAAAQAGLLVAAWGAHGSLGNRGHAVRALLDAGGYTVHHLGLTADGQPRHPLYLPKSAPLGRLPPVS